MPQLKSTSSGCVYVNGNPYQKGSLAVSYAGTNVTIWERDNSNNRLINNRPFGEITNDDDEFFESLSALKSFIEDNFFFELGEGSGGGGGGESSGGVSEKFTIADGFSGVINSSRLEGVAMHIVFIFRAGVDGTEIRNAANYSPDSDTGEIDLTALELVTNDIVIVTGKKS
ncbi:MAG TPA: hypothetical protein VL098_12675 [Flavipsychrobacter sp.]|nr:hypothetical protein [Flavipsychrobacter sp.]